MLKVCISGGPCSGKTSCLSKLYDELTEKLNKKVFIVPESATELITNGIYPSENISMKEFQSFVLDKQLNKEKLYDKACEFYDKDNVVILYDRGLLDQMAYIDKETFEELLRERNIPFSNAIDRYDILIHLTTAAKGTNAYTTANNTARRETPEEAIIADNKTLKANLYHPHMKVIDNQTGFEEKIQRVLSVVFNALGEPSPSEIERKFLIKKPSDKMLNSLDFSSKSEITQTYLKSNGNTERRLRQRGNDKDGYTFYYAEKTPVSEIERIEKDEKIDIRKYVSLLNEADTSLHQIQKTRYAFLYKNQYFELDIYPFSDEYAILEIEVQNEDDEIQLPDFLEYVKEVTNDNSYKNHSLAKTLILN